MPMFVCESCGTLENTATGAYWEKLRDSNLPRECSLCDTGKWHGKFEKNHISQVLDGVDESIWEVTLYNKVEPLNLSRLSKELIKELIEKK